MYKSCEFYKSKLPSSHVASHEVTNPFFCLISLQMRSAYNPALNSRTATWCLQCAVKRAACSSVFDPASTGVLSGRLIIGREGCLQRNVACPHIRLCSHVLSGMRRLTQVSVWLSGACRSTNKAFQSPSITEREQDNDTANCAAAVGQWHKHVSGPNLGPVNSAVFVCILL